MRSEVARYDQGGEVATAPAALNAPTELDQWVLVVRDVARLAAQIADTPFVPDGIRGNPAAVTATILTGREMGLGPMTALQHIHIVKGKPGKSAEIMRAMVLAAGHSLRDVEVTDTRVVLEGRRQDEETWTRVVFTADQARKAKIDLGGYPEDKLYARATTRLCRRKFADVIGGIAATIDELEDGDTPALPGLTGAGTAPAAPEPSTPPKRTAKRRTAPKTPPKPVGSGETPVDPATAPEPVPETPPTPPPSLPGEDALDEPADAEIVEDESAGTAPVSRPQLDKLHAQLAEVGVDDRGDKLTIVSLLVQRPLDTSNDLSAREASQAIDVLAQVLASDDPKRMLDVVLGELED